MDVHTAEAREYFELFERAGELDRNVYVAVARPFIVHGSHRVPENASGPRQASRRMDESASD